MDCSVIQDLIPLYIDDCCSPESAALVNEHVEHCAACREAMAAMQCTLEQPKPVEQPATAGRVRQWKASVLQSVLMLCSFLVITLGVALEASTPYGWDNSFWALTTVVPATGFMLSLTNWYFLPLYKSKKSFSRWSLVCTVGITLAAYLWTLWHYGMLSQLVSSPISFLFVFQLTIIYSIIFTALLCVASFCFSKWYATMLGKE